MKVIFLTTSYPLSPASLSGIFVRHLVNKLANYTDVCVITPAEMNVYKRFRQDNVSIIPAIYAPLSWQQLAHSPGGIPVAIRSNPWLWFLFPGMLISLGWNCLRESKTADVIHANWAICGCLAGFTGKILNKPVITTLRGDDVKRAERNKIDLLILKLCFFLSNKIVCVSSDMQDWLTEKFPNHAYKLTLIENGVDDVFIKAGENNKVNSSNNTITLITVGSLIPRKGVDIIIKAWLKIYSLFNARLEIIGSGPEESSLKGLIGSRESDYRISFAGSMLPAKVAASLHEADIFVLASYSEGRPNVLLEAMAAGLAIIASDIRGVRELIKHEQTGLLFKSGDANHLAEQLKIILCDRDLLNKLAKSGRKTIIERNLTWDNCASKYKTVYEQVCSIK